MKTTIRYFECKADGANKFWEITVTERSGNRNSCVVRYGKIGTNGTSLNSYKGLDEINALLITKIAKGYKEKSIASIKEEKKEKLTVNDYLEIF